MEQYARGVHMYRKIKILSDGLYDYVVGWGRPNIINLT